METKGARALPARLEGVRRRFECWRATRQAHARIPDCLWASAALAAGRYGVSRTAHVLRVNYDALKKRLGRKRAAAGRGKAEGEPRLVEPAPFAARGSGECLVEWEDGGAKPQTLVERSIPLVAGQQDGSQDAGGPSVASSALGRQSRSHASRAGVALGRAGGLRRSLSC